MGTRGEELETGDGDVQYPENDAYDEPHESPEENAVGGAVYLRHIRTENGVFADLAAEDVLVHLVLRLGENRYLAHLDFEHLEYAVEVPVHL